MPFEGAIFHREAQNGPVWGFPIPLLPPALHPIGVKRWVAVRKDRKLRHAQSEFSPLAGLVRLPFLPRRYVCRVMAVDGKGRAPPVLEIGSLSYCPHALTLSSLFFLFLLSSFFSSLASDLQPLSGTHSLTFVLYKYHIPSLLPAFFFVTH